VGRGAESEESDVIASTDLRNAQTAVADDARAQERRSLQIIESGGQGKDEVLAG
jgi:hypothetical protein